MKKILTLALLFAFAATLSAQICNPNTSFTKPGYYPDSLAPATLNQPYDQTITVIVPADTTIELIPGFPTTLPIDSIVVTSITNLPPGFAFECAPASCGFPGGSTGCMKVTGNPVTGAGEYNLIVNVMAYSAQAGSLSPLAETIDFGKFLIIDPIGVKEEFYRELEISALTPQPLINEGKLSFNAPQSGILNLRVMNIVGETVFTDQFYVSKGKGEHMFAPQLNSGLYLLSAEINGYSTIQKFVVSK